MILEGSAHAQFIFQTDQGERLEKRAAEVAIDLDLVQDGVITHCPMVGTRPVNRCRRNPVIVVRSGATG